MDKLEPPQSFLFEGNISHGWKTWSKHFDFFLTATESDEKSDKVKTSILLSCIGPKGREIYETFQFATEGDRFKLDTVLEKFTAYCNPRKNITIIRHKFFTYKQQEGQSFNDYIIELKKRSSECEFGNLQDSLVKDMIVCGVIDNSLRERLLRDADLTLDKAIASGHAAEETRLHAKELNSFQNNVEVNKVSRKQGYDVRKKTTSNKFDKQSKRSWDVIKRCKFCNSTHNRGQCPAYGKKCRACKQLNHFQMCCPYKQVKEIYEAPSLNDSSDEEFFIDSIEKQEPESKTISAVNGIKSDWSVSLEMNGAITNFKIDTGAQCNVIPKYLLNSLLPRPKLKPTTMKLSAYNGTEIPVAGKCITSIKLKNQKVKVLFIVVDADSVPIIGLNTSEKLNLIKRVYKIANDISVQANIEDEFVDCFGEIGCLKRTHHIEVKEDVKPIIAPIRKIPFALKDKLKEELHRMMKLEIIEPVEKPTDWVNALVIVSKPNGKLRICLDPRPLNKAIKRQHHKLPTAEEIISQMHGAHYFTKLDASNGFWQIRVDNESADLLTFGTPFGRYRFKRLPFGIHSASEVFQAEVANIISGIEGCANSQDDIIVWGATKKEHDQRLRSCLTRIITTTSPCLKFFNPNLPTRLRPDASSEGLGALLEQNHGSENDEKWHPIAYASRALQPFEQRYAQIEKEVLSVVFGTERFHEYLYGRHFTVYNDHQPLKSIFSKSIVDCPPRIQRFFLKLQKYDFNLEYAPGKTMVVSDALSRAYINDNTTEIPEAQLIHQVISTFQLLPISKSRLVQLQQETSLDPVLQQLINYTLHGWPEKFKISQALKPYYNIRSEIVFHENLLLKGQRIIVPSSLRKTMKEIIHQGHSGIERCKFRARQSLYWPGMNAEIEELVARCSLCLTHRNRQQKETFIAHEIPNAPWIKVASDVFHLFGHHYVIVVDYYSKYIEIEHIADMTTSSVIDKLKKIFARHGIPKELFSDNGPEYASTEFVHFSKKWDFKHSKSSPHYPQSNGLVERSIQTVKQVLKKAKDAKEDPYLSLLILNTVPGSDGKSPAIRLFNRNVRTTLPSLVQSFPTTSNVKNSDRVLNKKHRDYPSINPDSVVRMRIDSDKNWEKKGLVVEKCSEPRSYNILNEKGNIVRRNRRHLIPCYDEFKIQPDYDIPTQNQLPHSSESVSNGVSVPSATTTTTKPHQTESLSLPKIPDSSYESMSSAIPTTGSDQNPEQLQVTRRGRIIRKPLRYR